MPDATRTTQKPHVEVSYRDVHGILREPEATEWPPELSNEEWALIMASLAHADREFRPLCGELRPAALLQKLRDALDAIA